MVGVTGYQFGRSTWRLMLLSKQFLQAALPYATLSVNGVSGSDGFFEQQDQEILVTIDSRDVQVNDLFVALKGNKVDGHTYIAQALERGAAAVLIAVDAFTQKFVQQHGAALAGKLVIVVPDTLQALVDLAKAWRGTFTCPIVGITGSIGKTTTKEIVRTILLEAQRNAYVSYKNQNTVIGLCMNILRMQRDATVGIFEVSLHHKDVLAQLADILRPTMGLITCIAHSHVQHIGSLADVSVQKRQLFSRFTPRDIGIIFGDQDLLTAVNYNHPVAKFGFKMRNQVQARKVRVISNDEGNLQIHFVLKWFGKKADVVMQGNHQVLVNNALAASTIAYFLNIPFEVVVQALARYVSFEHRFQVKKIKQDRGLMISDCYNANPESMKAALTAFDQMKSPGSKVAVLGDMLELGEKESYWHRQIGRFLNKTETVDTLILVGQRAGLIAKTAPINLTVNHVSSWEAAAQLLHEHLSGHKSLVLVKGSRGMALDKMVAVFEE